MRGTQVQGGSFYRAAITLSRTNGNTTTRGWSCLLCSSLFALLVYEAYGVEALRHPIRVGRLR